jgi:hypothetical protein
MQAIPIRSPFGGAPPASGTATPFGITSILRGGVPTLRIASSLVARDTQTTTSASRSTSR